MTAIRLAIGGARPTAMPMYRHRGIARPTTGSRSSPEIPAFRDPFRFRYMYNIIVL